MRLAFCSPPPLRLVVLNYPLLKLVQLLASGARGSGPRSSNWFTTPPLRPSYDGLRASHR